MTLHELNKLSYAQLPTLNKIEMKQGRQDIITYLKSHPSNFYMMLEHETHYYTIYTYIDPDTQDEEKMADEIIDVVKTLGTIKGIIPKDNMIEFWILNQENKQCYMYGLFDYQAGVIKV